MLSKLPPALPVVFFCLQLRAHAHAPDKGSPRGLDGIKEHNAIGCMQNIQFML